MDDRWTGAAASYIEKDQGNEMIVILWSSDSKWEIVRVYRARTPVDVKFKASEVRLAPSMLDWQVRGRGLTYMVRSRGSRGQCPRKLIFLSINRCVNALWYMRRSRC